jgi:hypothetical protein
MAAHYCRLASHYGLGGRIEWTGENLTERSEQISIRQDDSWTHLVQASSYIDVLYAV